MDYSDSEPRNPQKSAPIRGKPAQKESPLIAKKVTGEADWSPVYQSSADIAVEVSLILKRTGHTER